MELAFVVYMISFVESFRLALLLLLPPLIVFLLLCAVLYADANSYYERKYNLEMAEETRKSLSTKIKKLLKYLIIVGMLIVVTPTKQTAYLMVGAYAAQKIAQSDGATQIGSKVLRIINQNLDNMIDKEIKK